MSEWKEYKLGDIAEVQTGPFGSQLHQSDYKPIGTPIITVEHLGENKIIHQNVPLVGEEDRQRLIKYTLQEGDIVFSRVGSVDRRVYVTKDENGWMFSGRCLRVRPDSKKVHPKFLSYFFGQESFKETIRRIAVGATMPSINTTILSEVEILLPDLDYQNNIASILSSLDDKIELLHRQNKTLEALAETLFRQWFPTNQKLNIKSEKFGNLVQFIKGKKPTEAVESYTEGLIPQILIETFDTGKTLYSDPTDMVIAIEKDILMVMDGASSGRVEIGVSGIVGSTIGLFRPAKDFCYPLFLFYFLKSNEDFITDNTTGSAIPHTDRALVLDLDVEYPSIEKVKEFETIAENYFTKKQANHKQIRTLTQLRDTLLPKLMSGEVRVKKLGEKL